MAVRLVDDLLNEYRKIKNSYHPERLIFHGVNGQDVYNPTAVFHYMDMNVICGRVEKRDSECSKAVFFSEREKNHFYPLNDVPQFDLQDPFIARILDFYVFGGTKVYHENEDSKHLSWCTDIYYGKNLNELKFLISGPKGMKDIRIIELKDKRIGVFSRLQGEKGGRGKIGFTIVDSLKDLSASIIENAPLLDLFCDEEWGGANELTMLEDGTIGVLGHIAKFSEGYVRHYYPAVFCLNPDTLEYTDMHIISERTDFLNGAFKREDLQDVLFSGGVVFENDNEAILYVGVSDCEVQKIKMKNPFVF